MQADFQNKATEEIKADIETLTQCEWVKEEFRNASLGDWRLYLRLLVVAEHLARHPEAPINQANEVWRKTKAAYRFFDNKKATPELIRRPHLSKTFERIRLQADEVIIAQDTCFLNYSHMQSSTDLGPIGEANSSNMGLVMHTSLAVTFSGLPLGVVDQNIWARSIAEHGKAKEHKKKPIEQKESFKWLLALREYYPFLRNIPRITTVCDREADIYEFFCDAKRLGANVLVRAMHNRNIKEEERKLWDFIDQQTVAATYTLEIPKQPGRKKRKANMQIKFSPVNFNRPADVKDHTLPTTLSLWIVKVNEIDPPDDDTKISWTLISNTPVATLPEAIKCIQRYRCRWTIEILHRVMKSGCNIEEARLEKNHRRIPYITLKTIIAWKLLQIVHYSRVSPEEPATSLLSQTECNVLYAVINDTAVSDRSFNCKKALPWLAQLGGFLARKSDKNPGPTHVWRGWQRLQDFTHMYTLSKK